MSRTEEGSSTTLAPSPNLVRRLTMFTEANAVENFIRDLLCGRPGTPARLIREATSPYGTADVALAATGLGWEYIPPDQLLRAITDVLVESHLRDALLRLNPTIAARPDRADE